MDGLSLADDEVEVAAAPPGRTRAWSRAGAQPSLKQDPARRERLESLGAGLSVKGVLDDHDDHEPCESDEDEPKE